jgi:hypothetical protein
MDAEALPVLPPENRRVDAEPRKAANALDPEFHLVAGLDTERAPLSHVPDRLAVGFRHRFLLYKGPSNNLLIFSKKTPFCQDGLTILPNLTYNANLLS